MTDSFLNNLDNLLAEFYSSTSDNARKACIEQDLEGLKSSDSCWEYCVKLLQHSKSQYSQWWALSTLEDYVARRWTGISENDRNSLRNFVYEGAMKENQIQFIAMKYIKVFINIGIRQWSTTPLFFEQTMTLCRSSASSQAPSVGLTMLLVLSEELNRPRVDISSVQLSESKTLLSGNVPLILSTLVGLLDALLTDNTANTPSRNSLSTVNTRTVLQLDEDSRKLGAAALQCLAHLLSWVSISDALTPGLINTVFVFARQGTDNCGDAELGTHAMSCINEVVGRNLVPAHLEDFILQLFQQTLHLLTGITEHGIQNVDRGYLKKLIEFLNLFTSGHLRRVESNASFPVLEFLALLFKFTASQADVEMFCAAVDVCGSWVDFLLSVQGSLSPDGTVPRYGSALTTLAQLLLTKVRFHTNNAVLQEIEQEVAGSADGEVELKQTEWDVFVGRLTQLLSKIIELHPVHISSLLIGLYNEHCEAFYQLQANVVLEDKGVRVENMDSSLLCKMLCDISTVSYLAQLALPSLVGEHFETHYSTTQGILFHCMKCIETAGRLNKGTVPVTTTTRDVARGYASILESNICILSTFSQWFAQYGYHHKNSEQYSSMLATVLDAVLPCFNNQADIRVQQVTIDLLNKIILVCRPSFLLSIASVQALFCGCVAEQYASYSDTARSTLYKSLTLAIVLPWLYVTEQQWEGRSQHFEQFVTGIFSKLLQIKASDIDSPAKLTHHTGGISRSISCLCDVVGCVALRETKAKQIVCRAILPVVSHVIQLLPHFEKDSKIFEHVLSFTIVLCDAVRVQLGSHFLQELVGLCLSNFTKSTATESASDIGKTTVEKFIELLTTVVREPSSIYKSFTGDIINIALSQINVHVEKRESLNPGYFTLLHSLLDFNWSYFYPRNAENRELCENENSFLSILQLFGSSLLKPDFNLIKQNVISLCDLNDKHELFTKVVFVAQLKTNFVTALLQLLFSGSVPIVGEEIEDILYQLAHGPLAQRQTQQSYTTTLHNYLASVLPPNTLQIVLARVQVQEDAASFKLNLRSVVGEAKFYMSCRV